MTADHQELIDTARPLVRNMTLGRPDWDAASVAAAIRTPSGNIYTGVCIHLSCGLGFCAEHAAAAEMIKAAETQIETIVAVAEDSVLHALRTVPRILLQVDPRNANATVILNGGRLVKLKELMPEHWLTNDL